MHLENGVYALIHRHTHSICTVHAFALVNSLCIIYMRFTCTVRMHTIIYNKGGKFLLFMANFLRIINMHRLCTLKISFTHLYIVNC